MIVGMLRRGGIERFEKNVVHQLLEFLNYYTTDIISEARSFSEFVAKHPPAGIAVGNQAGEGGRDPAQREITVGDLKLAIETKAKDYFPQPLPLQALKEVADKRNRDQLP